MNRRDAFLLALAAATALGAGPGALHHPNGRPADGIAEDVSLSDTGAILLAPASTEIVPGEQDERARPQFWSTATDLKGTLYIGAGAAAQVVRVDRKGSVEEIFEVDDLGVRALAADITGNLYVATFPNGRVYRLGADGKTEVWFQPEERYLWAMAADAFDRLFVATGEKGIVYVVTARGEGRPFFDSDEPHITSLVADPTGRLIAGSAGRGILYRLDNQGRAEVILDSGLEEISAITTGSDGTIYAAAISEPVLRRPRRPGDRSDELTIEVTPSAEDDILEDVDESRRKVIIDLSDLYPSAAEGAAPPPASRVYKILPGRTPALVWTSQSERAYALALDASGHLLIGTGLPGRLYRVEPDSTVTLLRQYPAAQVTALATSPDGMTHVLTSNPGRAYIMEVAPASSGHYVSPVQDAGVVATWGSILWDADVPPGTRVEFAARSGNSAVPDETWSSWSEAGEDAKGSALRVPAARYLQWRAELSRLKSEATPVLRDVTVTYLPENRPPSVRRVTVGRPGAPRPGPSAAAKHEEPKKETVAPADRPKTFWLNWVASDPDGDPLRHTASVRRVEDAEWKTLAGAIKEPPYEIDPSSLAEGRYVARVEADDREANGADRGLVAEARSEPFDVDRTPPVIEPGRPEEDGGAWSLAFTARDAMSSVARAEWSSDPEGPWTMAVPRDGIADTPSESYLIRLPASAAPRRVILRVADAAGNTATLEVSLSTRR